MVNSMARFTECYTVPNIKSVFLEFCKSKNMMSVKFAASFATILASPVVTVENGVTPVLIYHAISSQNRLRCNSTLPCSVVFTKAGGKVTLPRTVFLVIARLGPKIRTANSTYPSPRVVSHRSRLGIATGVAIHLFFSARIFFSAVNASFSHYATPRRI